MKTKFNMPQCRGTPVVRLRLMSVVTAALVVLVFGPLAMVWKQAYLSSASIRRERCADTLSFLNKEIAALRLERERLAGNDRIEKFARSVLLLDYPLSDRIVIVPIDEKPRKTLFAGAAAPLLARAGGLPKGGRP